MTPVVTEVVTPVVTQIVVPVTVPAVPTLVTPANPQAPALEPSKPTIKTPLVKKLADTGAPNWQWQIGAGLLLMALGLVVLVLRRRVS